LTSIWRLKEARKAGYQIPDLETAMRNVRLQEAIEAEKQPKGGKQAHAGQAGQMVTAKERRKEQGEKTKAEIQSEEKVKNAQDQTEQGKREKTVNTAAS
jgi:small subunit ribosomal protein S17